MAPAPKDTDFGRAQYSPTFDATTDLRDVVTDWVHHRLVLAVRMAMESNATTQAQIGEVLGIKAPQVRRVLSGSGNSRPTFEQVVGWALFLGVQVLPQLDTQDDLLPPKYRGRVDWTNRADNMFRPVVADQ